MEKCVKVAALYIATLKAIYLIHQQNHWLVKGNDFYGDHLLFQRIYESAQENLDGAAEKMIAIFGDDCLDYKIQADLLNKLLLKYGKLSEDPVACSLAIEKDFIKYSKVAYECFEKEGTMTLGLDDFIMATSSAREESVYLLTRAQGSDEE
jgi:hypothetical protein